MDGPLGDAEEMARFEALAEEAHGAMYDAAPHNAKDRHEDASRHIAQAIRLARALGRDGDAARLQARSRHFDAVYNHQFRHAGR
jgi:hypothetical protein